MKLFTIGHSNHNIEAFITLLNKHGVTAIADVRSHPYSRYLEHFNQKILKQYLKDAGISYVFLGDERQFLKLISDREIEKKLITHIPHFNLKYEKITVNIKAKSKDN